MSRIEYNPSLNDRVNGQLGDLGVEIQIPLSSIKELIVPPAPPAPVAPYKVYTALVTQSGGDNTQYIDIGSLTIGVTYQITNLSPGMDFTNVGAPNNEINTYFVATGTTPASWGSNEGIGNETLRYNLGAPVVIVLENTIGNIWFTYDVFGTYYANSNALFLSNKTFCQNIVLNSAPDFLFFYPSINFIELTTTAGDNGLFNTPIEIRVYN